MLLATVSGTAANDIQYKRYTRLTSAEEIVSSYTAFFTLHQEDKHNAIKVSTSKPKVLSWLQKNSVTRKTQVVVMGRLEIQDTTLPNGRTSKLFTMEADEIHLGILNGAGKLVASSEEVQVEEESMSVDKVNEHIAATYPVTETLAPRIKATAMDQSKAIGKLRASLKKALGYKKAIRDDVIALLAYKLGEETCQQLLDKSTEPTKAMVSEQFTAKFPSDHVDMLLEALQKISKPEGAAEQPTSQKRTHDEVEAAEPSSDAKSDEASHASETAEAAEATEKSETTEDQENAPKRAKVNGKGTATKAPAKKGPANKKPASKAKAAPAKK